MPARMVARSAGDTDAVEDQAGFAVRRPPRAARRGSGGENPRDDAEREPLDPEAVSALAPAPLVEPPGGPDPHDVADRLIHFLTCAVLAGDLWLASAAEPAVIGALLRPGGRPPGRA